MLMLKKIDLVDEGWLSQSKKMKNTGMLNKREGTFVLDIIIRYYLNIILY